jgi:hypothetical protein
MIQSMARLLTVAGLALTAVLLAGCGGGGGDDQAKVEASLRHFISGMPPEGGAFPIGAGPPRVRDNGCKDRHVTTKSGQVYEFHSATVYLPAGLALWSCVVTFRNGLKLPADVAVKGSEVVAVFPGASPDSPKQPPAKVYEGGP